MARGVTRGFMPAAVLFDMDGVVTDTARAHAAAWKRLFDEFLQDRAQCCGEELRPFDSTLDYTRYVDGKPRSGGVVSFLRSRGIKLPCGTPDDGTDRETVWGLSNRKDRYFHAWLDAHRVRAFPGTLRFIGELQAIGIPTAVFSASRNAEAVLRNAGVLELFDATLDGAELARLGLPGKPAPDMLLEAARRLDAPPADTVVFEDAIAGVRAGVSGGFGLVVGVDRGAGRDALKEAGAHLVVRDLSELRCVPGKGLERRQLATLPSALGRQNELRGRLAVKQAAVFLDYDGTLTPIVEDHTRAYLPESMRAAVARLARCCPVTIVSGRDLNRLRELVALDSVILAGSHGFQIAGPGSAETSMEKGTEFLPMLDEAEQQLRRRLAGITGHDVERKRFSIAVHFRRVAKGDVSAVRAVVDDVLDAQPQLRLGHGKKVLEIRPDLTWDKGRAVQWILSRQGLDRAGAVPLYIGDDLTDEDAFRVLAGWGVCIAVRHDEDRQTAADYTLRDVEEVRQLLKALPAMLEGCPPDGEESDDVERA